MNAPSRYENYVLGDGEPKYVPFPRIALLYENSRSLLLALCFARFVSSASCSPLVSSHRLSVKEDTKIPDAATFTINKEDHTLANMLRSFVPFFPKSLLPRKV